MRILLLHPGDHPFSGAWADASWDLIVDLGFCSPAVYAHWSARAKTSAISLHQFAGDRDSYRWVNRVLESGRGRLLDWVGLDWWEIISVIKYQQLQGLYLLRCLSAEIGSGSVDCFATRPHTYADLLPHVFGCAVKYFERTRSGLLQSSSKKLSAMRKLRPSQVAEIACDKWDASYRVRRYVARRRVLKKPVLLIPSAYSNVTRLGLAYAAQLPERQFLLAITRRSARQHQLTENVSTASLAAYTVPRRETEAEIQEMLSKWKCLSSTLSKTEELRQPSQAGIFDGFPVHIANGLRIRYAWQTLMEQEPVEGVLCGDDLNYYTRLPLLLARRLGRRAIYCYHGALDGGMLFKQPCAEVHLVRGEMERDYLLAAGATEPERIEIAAPGGISMRAQPASDPAHKLVFFSEPYENSGGRVEEIYRELLPRLCAVARRVQRKIVVKLHPFESEKARKRLLNCILPETDRRLLEIVSGAPAEQIISRAWCGVGVDSSVALDCAVRGVPYFLCGWLACNGFGYAQQFAKFGAGKLLDCPEEIERIPEMVSHHAWSPAATRQLWSPAMRERLDEILFGQARLNAATQCAC